MHSKIEEKNMFKNCHFTDFTKTSAVASMQEEIEKQITSWFKKLCSQTLHL